MIELTPKQIIQELDKYIIGQEKAKRSVAVALRNRYRRNLLPDDIKNEITPKNILMVGPTGVGKTEIARRLAKLVNAPFVKVEATKFTEVGYVGRDVDSIVRDITEVAIMMVKTEKIKDVEEEAREIAINNIAELLIGKSNKKAFPKNPFEMLFSYSSKEEYEEKDEEDEENHKMNKYYMVEKIKSGELEEQKIEIELEDNSSSTVEMLSNLGLEQISVNFQDVFGGVFPKKTKRRMVSIKDALKIFTQAEAQKLIDMDDVIEDAIKRVENRGIIFIDEIDKIAGKGYSSGPDVSREGVQRDILPIVEGSTVMTKYGLVKTDHMLFISAGAFHVSKVSDLIPELQGRFPVRVELDSLKKHNFEEILIKPNNALTKQYAALLSTEGIKLEFEDEAIEEIAEIAAFMNEQSEDIGARRLYTVMEKLFEELSFNATEMEEKEFTIDLNYVKKALVNDIKDKDISKYII